MSDLVSQNLNMIFKSPKGETVHALKDLNFTIKKGELLTVLGPSGCGKTTLLNIAAAIFNKVVFPHPDGPRTVNSSPFLIVKFKSFNAWTVSPLGDLKIIFRFWETKSLIKRPYIKICIKKIGTN